MAEYYAIERSPEYLAHYGIKGMRWGVRKAIESGNARRLSRQYAKAQRKLAKLEKRANSGKKYARRAAALGAGAAAAGGLAIAGTEGVSRGIAKLGGHAMNASKAIGKGMVGVGQLGSKVRAGSKAQKMSSILIRRGYDLQSAGNRGSNLQKGFADASKAVNAWGKANSISSNATDAGIKALRKYGGLKGNKLATRLVVNDTVKNAKAISNNTIARIGAGAAAAGLGAGAAYNAYRAATTKKAAQKAAQFRSEMNKAFAGTQYANGSKPRQGKKRRRK